MEREKLNTFNKLVETKEFDNILNQLLNEFKVEFDNELRNDVKQACSIAVWESLEKYNANKVGGNFWGYAYLRMKEYAKREVINFRNQIHIPLQYLNGTSGYEQIKHKQDWSVFDYFDIDQFSVEWFENVFANDISVNVDVSTSIDIENFISRLDKDTRYILEVHSELKKGKQDKNDFASIAKDINLPTHKVRETYNKTKERLIEFLR